MRLPKAPLAAMNAHGRQLSVQHTSTVWTTQHFPRETTPTAPIHPYANTKLAAEQMLQALAASGDWRVIILRYFNPVGAHPSGRIGENPIGIPNNLFPIITQVALGQREKCL